jgi:hypothetical protein
VAERIEIDAKDVLEKYVELIRQTGGRGPQDVTDLPAPKHVVKEILLFVLRNAPRDSDVTAMKRAFLALATFQDLKEWAKNSLDRWDVAMERRTGPSMSDAELSKIARDVVSVGAALDSVQEQIEIERAHLTDELAKAGF